MEVFKKILIGIYIAVCVILILVTTFQNKDSQNSAEDTYENPKYNNFYDKNKGRTKKGATQRNTIILGVLYAVLSIVTGAIYVIYS